MLFCILALLHFRCKSAQLSEAGIEQCLTRTDFAVHSAELRASIGWHIGYAQKVRETTCCALEPRPGVLAKRSDLAGLKGELLQRIDLVEKKTTHEDRQNLRRSDNCYAALMDLYHDVAAAEREQSR